MTDFKNVQTAIDTLLDTKSFVRRRKKNDKDKKKELFFQIINGIDEVIIRSNLMIVDFDIDNSKYDESFLMIIDALIYMNFGKDAAELVSFYIWDRLNPDGSINPVLCDNDEEIILNNPYELWELMLKVNPKL